MSALCYPIRPRTVKKVLLAVFVAALAGLECAEFCEKGLARDQAGIGSLFTAALSGVWPDQDRRAPIQNSAPLSVLYGAL